jgi:putative addiction module component (TIGR02574 family)
MSDFTSVLSDAQGLPESERLRLIEALWNTVEPSGAPVFSEEWEQEIERRLAALDAGEAETIPWDVVRKQALARLGHGKAS